MLLYDCEIIKGILGRNEKPIMGIEYVKPPVGGSPWDCHDQMGISVICAYDYDTKRYHVFLKDNMDDFRELLLKHDWIIGFNSISFDNNLCKANDIHIPEGRSYDILVEIWKAAGLGPKFQFPSHAGFSLNACCKENFSTEKSGNGALAPIDWQQNRPGKVIDYCINDVKLTKQLMDRILETGALGNPKKGPNKTVLRIQKPGE